MPFVDSMFEESSRQASRAEGAVWEYYLPFGVFLAFAIRDILLADEAVADEVSFETAECAENFGKLRLRALNSWCTR